MPLRETLPCRCVVALTDGRVTTRPCKPTCSLLWRFRRALGNPDGRVTVGEFGAAIRAAKSTSTAE